MREEEQGKLTLSSNVDWMGVSKKNPKIGNIFFRVDVKCVLHSTRVYKSIELESVVIIGKAIPT